MTDYYSELEHTFARLSGTAPASEGKVSKKRQDIVAAAKRLFSEKGYAATTTAAIAREAATTEKTLFKYFATKNELFAVVGMEAIFANVNGIYLDKYLEESDLREALIRFFTIKTDACTQDGESFKLFLQAILMEKELREALVAVLSEGWNDLVEGGMKKVMAGLNREPFDPASPSIFHIILFSTIMGYGMLRTILLPDWEADDKKNIEAMTDAILYGFAERDSS